MYLFSPVSGPGVYADLWASVEMFTAEYIGIHCRSFELRERWRAMGNATFTSVPLHFAQHSAQTVVRLGSSSVVLS